MVSRLMEDSNKGTSEFQFGFGKGRSVVDARLHASGGVSGSYGRYTLGIFVDFKVRLISTQGINNYFE